MYTSSVAAIADQLVHSVVHIVVSETVPIVDYNTYIFSESEETTSTERGASTCIHACSSVAAINWYTQ